MSQERRLMRRLHAGVGQAPMGLPRWTPQDEQDDRRNRLAERLLETLIEEASWDGEEVKDGRTKAEIVALAEAALAAAEVIYPEIPGAEELMMDHGVLGDLMRAASGPLPPAAQAGLESVIVRQNDAQGTVREGAWLMTAEEYARRLAAGEVGKRLVLIDHSEPAELRSMAELLAAAADRYAEGEV